MAENYDAIIIGAGIMGCSIALQLSKSGRKTLCIDKNPAAAYGSTSSSSAIIRTPYSTLASCALAWEGLHAWQNFEDHLGRHGPSPVAEYVSTGLVVIPEVGDTLADCQQHLIQLKIPFENLSAAQLSKKHPKLNMGAFSPVKKIDDDAFGQAKGAVSPALWTPDAGYVSDPKLAAQNMKEAAENYGAVFKFNTSISEVIVDEGQVRGVITQSGIKIAVNIVINAAGPFSARVNAMAGIKEGDQVSGRPMRTEVCALDSPDSLSKSHDKQSTFIDLDTGTYYRTERGGSLLIGGAEPACDPLEWLDDPDNYNNNPSHVWTEQVYRTAQRVIDLKIPGQARGVVDMYDVTPDWTPVYDKSDVQGFYQAIGTSGNQFKNGPIVGELMVALIDYVESGYDHDIKPLQYACPRTDTVIDMAAFSRRRTVRTNVGNVMG